VKRIPRIIVAVGVLLVASTALGAPRYPANPSVSGAAIYLSADGISRLDPHTLEPRWHALRGLHTFEPVVGEGAILVGSPAGLYALDPATGAVIWQLASKTTLFSPAVDGGLAFSGGEDGSLTAITVEDGTVIWRRTFPGWVYPPAIVGERLIVGGASHTLWGLDKANGTVVWTIPLKQELVYRPANLGNDQAALTTFAGEVIVVNARDGSIAWRVTDPTPGFTPTAAEGLLLYGRFDGTLQARDQMSGALRWAHAIGGRLNTPVNVYPGVVTVASDQGHVVALNLKTGQVLWQEMQPKALIGSPVIFEGNLIVFYLERRTPVGSAYRVQLR
jgi:outer membrane protein assembly factor BamB